VPATAFAFIEVVEKVPVPKFEAVLYIIPIVVVAPPFDVKTPPKIAVELVMVDVIVEATVAVLGVEN
jgi:hypothetical protein